MNEKIDERNSTFFKLSEITWIMSKENISKYKNTEEKHCYLSSSSFRPFRIRHFYFSIIQVYLFLFLSIAILIFRFFCSLSLMKKRKKWISETYSSEHLLSFILSLFFLLLLQTPTRVMKNKFHYSHAILKKLHQVFSSIIALKVFFSSFGVQIAWYFVNIKIYLFFLIYIQY
jgi:hypothetical protein